MDLVRSNEPGGFLLPTGLPAGSSGGPRWRGQTRWGPADLTDSGPQRPPESQPQYLKVIQPKEDEEGLDEEEGEERGETLCGACGENYGSDEFWICCDMCEKWFHGKWMAFVNCVKSQIRWQEEERI
ncbi:hypothetical protein Taro_005993 [Colocasia esculenta]|uniref:PHD finger protein ALFIN-LIKE n=1 Tax=Colocasia esculenta TaxID=4460 RepID=A0A843TUQ9_COLES|nr:hypothetical protein [Colocasia esculenta]